MLSARFLTPHPFLWRNAIVGEGNGVGEGFLKVVLKSLKILLHHYSFFLFSVHLRKAHGDFLGLGPVSVGFHLGAHGGSLAVPGLELALVLCSARGIANG